VWYSDLRRGPQGAFTRVPRSSAAPDRSSPPAPFRHMDVTRGAVERGGPVAVFDPEAVAPGVPSDTRWSHAEAASGDKDSHGPRTVLGSAIAKEPGRTTTLADRAPEVVRCPLARRPRWAGVNGRPVRASLSPEIALEAASSPPLLLWDLPGRARSGGSPVDARSAEACGVSCPTNRSASWPRRSAGGVHRHPVRCRPGVLSLRDNGSYIALAPPAARATTT